MNNNFFNLSHRCGHKKVSANKISIATENKYNNISKFHQTPDSEDDYIYYVGSGEKIRFKCWDIFEDRPEYPVDWFKKNGKPKLAPDFAKDQNLATARSNVHAFLSGSTTNTTIPLEYLYYVCETITDELAEDWVNYGVTIPKGKVTPLSLLDLTQWIPSSNGEITANGPQQLNANAALYLLAMLMGASQSLELASC